MSTAVQPAETPAPTPSPTADISPRIKLVTASLIRALFVLGGIALAGIVVPSIWDKSIAPIFGGESGFVSTTVRFLLQVVAVVGVVYLGTRLAGANPPKGLRGGIFLCVSLIITIFFVVRAIGLNIETTSFGPYITLAVLAALIFGSYKLLLSEWAEGWMLSLEDQGWFHTHSFKKTQGLKVRRCTQIGVYIICGTGAWSIFSHGSFGTGDLLLPMPFGLGSLSLLGNKEIAIPLFIAAVAFWFAWRLVNVPTFADFLIATEAEMNKVSWSSKKRLFQDTIVVLVTCVLMTVFLLVADLLFGAILSWKYIGVLPAKKDAGKTVDGKKQTW